MAPQIEQYIASRMVSKSFSNLALFMEMAVFDLVAIQPSKFLTILWQHVFSADLGAKKSCTRSRGIDDGFESSVKGGQGVQDKRGRTVVCTNPSSHVPGTSNAETGAALGDRTLRGMTTKLGIPWRVSWMPKWITSLWYPLPHEGNYG
ncbi:hypothetical protein SELMODRAFT_425340 [Selaginella moellendorffii]|uniref:Uncharacterized protein n=1 Tax=Selaginella moellendorffii TaxID=88036 RepID=D8SSS8_SELML|nr:hypothetical protein SELMODRAFT_425340 [Selaginella moellendorffii]